MALEDLFFVVELKIYMTLIGSFDFATKPKNYFKTFLMTVVLIPPNIDLTRSNYAHYTDKL